MGRGAPASFLMVTFLPMRAFLSRIAFSMWLPSPTPMGMPPSATSLAISASLS